MFEAALAHSIPGVPIWMIGDNLTADCHGVAPFGVHAILVRTRADPAYERQASGLDEAVRLIESTRG
jgi:FMN phosphatase YigB (HAD superfamily)